MNLFNPVSVEQMALGQDDHTDDQPVGSPVRDTPPFEINDTPPREPAPWITPQPGKRENLKDGSADA